MRPEDKAVIEAAEAIYDECQNVKETNPEDCSWCSHQEICTAVHALREAGEQGDDTDTVDPAEQYYGRLKEHGKFDITDKDATIGWCPQCGPMEKCDEDGCCLCCGADMGTVPNYLNLQKRVESAEAVVREMLECFKRIPEYIRVSNEIQNLERTQLTIARRHGLEMV